MELEKLKRADLAIQELLDIRKQEEISIVGRTWISEQAAKRVADFQSSMRHQWLNELLPKLNETTSTLEYLLLRYEEMKKRVDKKVNINIPLVLSEEIYQILAIRYAVLLTIFTPESEEPKKRIVGALLMNTEFVGEIISDQEFEWCQQEAGLLRYAIYTNPSDPRACLRRIKNELEAIPREEEFTWCKHLPGLIRQAVTGYPTDPRKHLRRTKKLFDEIASEDEFIWCWDYPWAIQRAVVSHPSEPRDFLRKAKEELEKLRRNQELDWCKDDQNLLMTAVFHNSSNPELYLRETKDAINQIPLEPEFEWTKNQLGLLFEVVKRNAGNARQRLRRGKAELDAIKTHPLFDWCKDNEGLLIKAVFQHEDARSYLTSLKCRFDEISNETEFESIGAGLILNAVSTNPSDPKDFLRRIKRNEEEILEEEEFEWCHEYPSVVRQTVLSHRKDPRAQLRKIKQTIDEISTENEFSWCHNEPGLIKYAAVSHSKDPRAYLRRHAQLLEEILQNDVISSFFAKNEIKSTVKNFGQRASEHLLSVKNQIEVLRNLPEFEWCKDMLAFLRGIALEHNNFRSTLNEIKALSDEIYSEPEFSWFGDNPKLVLYAVERNPSNPRAFLREFKDIVLSIANEHEFSEISLGIIRNAVWSNRNNARERLRDRYKSKLKPKG